MLNSILVSWWVPNFGGCFVTDQRGINSALDASARVHSVAYVKISAIAWDWSQTYRCGETVKVGCDDGKQKDRDTAETDDTRYLLVTGSTNNVALRYRGKAADPLVFGAPKIYTEGTLTVDRDGKFVEFVGKIDDFLSFEAYVSVSGKRCV